MPPGSVSWDRYAQAWAGLHGGVDPRQARPSVRGWLRLGYRFAYLADRVHLTPGTVTALGLLACLSVPALAMRGGLGAVGAALLVVFAAVADTVDGALAVLGSRATRLGYVYDSVVDRLAEACWLVALWLVGAPTAVAVTAGGLSFLHEYARSRANAAGMTEIGAVTLGERPTRVVLTVVGLGLAGAVRPVDPALPAGVATFVTAAWVVFALIGLGQLFVVVHRVLAGRGWPTWKPAGAPRPDGSGSGQAPGGRPVPADHAPGPGGTPATAATSTTSGGRATGGDLATAGGPATGGGLATGGTSVAGDAAAPGGFGWIEPFPVDEELLAELAKLASLPAGTSVYTSRAAHRRSGRALRETEDGERSFVAWEVEMAQHVDEAEPPVQPPGA
jgi:CDP-diacylglycerol--glycerol-3-phosphate 3-phosphatidyltransferase